MKKYVQVRKRKAFLFDDHIGIFPPEAKDWLSSVSLSPEYTVVQRSGWVKAKLSDAEEEFFFLSEEWIRYDGFPDKETAIFYIRRWNGRMGRDWKKMVVNYKAVMANLNEVGK